uniref:Uncharacterized protein n=1 Tax=Globisporangium ultimum (strain ATCC 200006 / CBS 805.95 / DAOM BR144) TaxID=431595 RepID=K3X648_GLOUD
MEAPRLLSFAISTESLRDQDDAAESSADPRTRSIRKNVVARGLARRYSDQKSREEALKARISRQSKQLAILEAYNRCKEAEEGRRASRDDDGGAAGGRPKSSSSAFPSSRAIISRKGPTFFPRNVSLRVLPDNQLDEEEDREHAAESEDEEELRSPTEEDLRRFAALAMQPGAPGMEIPASSPFSPVKPKKGADVPSPQQIVPGSASKRQGENGSSIDKSSAQVLCELRATKEIVVREQTVKQLCQLLPVLNAIADELGGILQEKAAASAILSAANAASPMREKRGSSSSFPMVVAPLSVRRRESGQSNLARAESQVKELSTRFAELAEKAQHRMKQFVMLVATLQESSMNAAEAIVEWRYFRQRRCRFTNFQPLYRFPWKKMKVANYLTHMDEDMYFLFATAALRVALGSCEIAYNPLLLSRKRLDALGFADGSFVSTTFLTERRSDDTADSRPDSTSANRSATDSPEKTKLQFEALREAMKLEYGFAIKPPTINHDRARAFLETIQQEKELELREIQKADDERQRVAAAYNPFDTIKAIGGVEKALTHLISTQSAHTAELLQQLRRRQEDTTRSATTAKTPLSVDQAEAQATSGPRQPSEQLRVNSRRLRQMLEKRMEQAVSTAECEVRPVKTWGLRNKLPGQVTVRKLSVKRQQSQFARKIQNQFRAHRRRRTMLYQLSWLISETQQSAVHIQRIFRGYCAKKEVNFAKTVAAAERRRLEAGKKIFHAYRQYKRRLRHRCSMTVESIAQVQLFNIQYQKLQEEGEDAVDRYRRVGEERRRQRVVLLQKHKLEQLELEHKRDVAAIRIQALVRGHLAKCELANLRKERKSHLTAVSVMTLQSNVRRFLKRQVERRLRFRKDLERVNRSAVRIQSIYRGYNSRASLLYQLDETMRESLEWQRLHEQQQPIEDDDEPDETSAADEDSDRLPLLHGALSRVSSSCSIEETTHDGLHAMIAMLAPSSAPKAAAGSKPAVKLTLPPLRPADAATPVSKRPSFVRQQSFPHSSQPMTRVELKLKEPTIDDNFDQSSARHESVSELRGGSRNTKRAS